MLNLYGLILKNKIHITDTGLWAYFRPEQTMPVLEGLEVFIFMHWTERFSRQEVYNPFACRTVWYQYVLVVAQPWPVPWWPCHGCAVSVLQKEIGSVPPAALDRFDRMCTTCHFYDRVKTGKYNPFLLTKKIPDTGLWCRCWCCMFVAVHFFILRFVVRVCYYFFRIF